MSSMHDQKIAAGGNGKKETECEGGEDGETVGRVEDEGVRCCGFCFCY